MTITLDEFKATIKGDAEVVAEHLRFEAVVELQAEVERRESKR